MSSSHSEVKDERSNAEIECINRALSDGQYCVYATVDANDSDFGAKLARRIKDYEKHTRDANGLEIAEKILAEKKAQNVIIACTWDPKAVLSSLQARSLDTEMCSVIQKPFMFS